MLNIFLNVWLISILRYFLNKMATLFNTRKLKDKVHLCHTISFAPNYSPSTLFLYLFEDSAARKWSSVHRRPVWEWIILRTEG